MDRLEITACSCLLPTVWDGQKSSYPVPVPSVSKYRYEAAFFKMQPEPKFEGGFGFITQTKIKLKKYSTVQPRTLFIKFFFFPFEIHLFD